MTILEAKRQAVPLMIGIAGTSGSGKTYSALLMAAGLAGNNGKVGLLDTELGRGAMYADDENIKKAMPGGKYFILDLTEPFTPDKYISAIKEFIKFGVTVLVIDSATHEWEGFGGCQDIAENNKLRGMPNWAKAKMEHKKLMNLITQCPMHVIFCLRAREKTRPVKDLETGKIEMVKDGLCPIQEKNFMYEMTLSMLLNDVDPGKPIITKCPKPLLSLFSDQNSIITKNMGEKLKDWSDGGEGIDTNIRSIKRELREAAMRGTKDITEFWASLDSDTKITLNNQTDFKAEIKSLAEKADLTMLEQDLEKQPGE